MKEQKYWDFENAHAYLLESKKMEFQKRLGFLHHDGSSFPLCAEEAARSRPLPLNNFQHLSMPSPRWHPNHWQISRISPPSNTTVVPVAGKTEAVAERKTGKRRSAMKKIVVMAAMFIGVLHPCGVWAQDKSPNGFYAPQCTWSADLLSDAYGWRLKFSQTTGRHAIRWPDLLMNKKFVSAPRFGDLVVFGQENGLPAEGHVGWVSFTSSTKIMIVHSNWKIGTTSFTHNSVPFRTATFSINGNKITSADTGKSYSVKFLRKY